MRGQRYMAANGGVAAEPLRPASTPPPPVKLPFRKWRDVILRVLHTDPLQDPHGQNRMRVIAVIEQAGVIEKILRHEGLWCGTVRVAPSRAQPNAKPAQREDSPYYASDPMPDYDNVFTD